VIGLLALLGGLLVLPAAPAAADSTYLCRGYQTCADLGYSHAGYKSAGKTMYWKMYAGHNCTNYAAYRMVQAGMANTRPWSGEGNASQWGKAMASITDATPTVGAIAWWKANVPGAGSSGHVAYVEQVVSSTEIVISEDSWGGDFDWRRLTKTAKGWPSGFIHFSDAVLVPITPPVIEGTPRVGATVTANPGSWNQPGTYSYQWSAAKSVIAGATAQTFVPTVAQRKKKLTVTVTATLPGFQPGTASAKTATAVGLGTFASTAAPTITGTNLVDETLTLSAGAWTPAPETSTVQWYAAGVPIPGATAWTLILGQDQIDKPISAEVSVQSTGYSKAVTSSVATEPVLAGTIAELTPYGVTGTPANGEMLTVTPGALDPVDSTVTYAWLRDGQPVPGATGPTYRLRPDDVGHRMSVRVDLTKRTYRSVSRTLEFVGPVTTRPTLKVDAVGGRGSAVVKIRLWTAGIKKLTGRVTLLVGDRKRVLKVKDGFARVLVGKVPPGKRKVVVLYQGTSVVLAAKARTQVKVQR
jgi:surface antigen